MGSMQILVVEDERRMAELLKRGLTEEGHQVVVARDGAAGLEMAGAASFDIIVADVMLPRMDGVTMTRRLRGARNQTPVLMLTARDAPSDIVRGLDSGADDYLTKPFSFDILLARVRAVSRRGAIPRPVCLEVADVRSTPPPVKSRAAPTDQPYAPGIRPARTADAQSGPRDRARHHSRIRLGLRLRSQRKHLEAFVRLLRIKIDVSGPKLIHTVRGVGYMMREP